MPSPDPSVGSLLSQLVRELGDLMRQELRLAQAETGEKIVRAQSGAMSLLAGLLVGFVALIILAQAVVLALSITLAAWLASIIVGVVLAIVGFILVNAGQSSLKAEALTPERTIRTLRDDKDMLMSKMS
jgi:uncharacterized membrane protein YqjE